jgi:hypothetical protein
MQITGDKVTESICKPEVLVGKTSGLDITLLKHQIIRIFALSDDRLKQFCCTCPRD